MSKDFKRWMLMSVVATVLAELMVYFMILPEYRWTEFHHALLWLIFPHPSILCAVMIPAWPKN